MRSTGKLNRGGSGTSTFDELQRIEEALGSYRHLANLRAFVDGQGDATVTLAGAAEAIGVSRCHLARLFQEKVGASFHQWLTLRRIYFAMKLMNERPITAMQTSHLVGFSSYRSFARAFTKVVGVPPSMYRQHTKHARIGQIRK